ncbi:MAG: oligosaccharide flippase family protein [Myxacorys californica WJT36-NPBG1]|jgi:O-antigen/teichoic acid export membrane protein|nr:oligosaccharide flippase family protein [Myxacorys californica WJT36-NPBG1]
MQSIQRFLQTHQSSRNRARTRVHRATVTGVATLISKGISVIAGFVSVPLTASYLEAEQFGVWLLLTSFVGWVSIVDLGLANSLTNALATADGQDDMRTAQKAVSSAFWLIICIAMIVSIISAIAYLYIPWNRVFNVHSLEAQSVIQAALVPCFIFFILSLILSIPNRVYQAYQEGYIYSFWCGLGNLFAVVGLMTAIQLQANLSALAGFFFIGLLLGDIFASIHLFFFHKRWLLPKFRYFCLSNSIWLVRSGIKFWIAQVSAILIFQTDLIIIAQLFGASTIATYGIALKLFALIITLQSAFTLPLWSTYAEAKARNDFIWIDKTFKQTIKLSITWSFCAGFLLTLVFPWLLRNWFNQPKFFLQSTIIAMFLTTVLVCTAQCVAMLANGLGEVNVQAVVAPISACTNLLLSTTLGHYFGSVGVALSTGICVLVFSLGIVGNDILKKLLILKVS